MTQAQKSRREVLEQFVADKPADAFARYGLALECVKLGDDSAATLHFQKLLETNPGYVAGYFQYGQLLSRMGRLDEARSQLESALRFNPGMQAAKQALAAIDAKQREKAK